MTTVDLPLVSREDVGAAQAPLLLVGHGTRSAAGVAQFRAFTARLQARLAPDGVTAAGGLIELAAPAVQVAVADLVEQGHLHVVAVPLMLVAAGHSKGDIPGALAREAERHPGLTYRYGRPVGADPRVLQAMEQRVDAVLPAADRADTHVLLVGRGSSDPDANAEVYRAARLFEEGRGFAGVEVAFISLAAPGVPAGLDRCERLGAEKVVVLPYFMFEGVLPDRIVEQSRAWGADHPAVEVRSAGLIGNCDELADVVLDRWREAAAGLARGNCDTCMYRTAMPGQEHRVGQPQTPHDHPDDPTHSHAHDPGHEHGHGHGHPHG